MTQPPAPKHPDNRALYFLITSAAILFLAMLALIVSMFIKTGRDVAADNPPATEVEQSVESANAQLDIATTALMSIRNEDNCFPDSAAAKITDYAAAALSSNAWDSTAQERVFMALAYLDEICTAEEKLQIQDSMTAPGVPAQLNSLVTDRTWISAARPIPDNAVHATSFATPSLNIRCQIDDAAMCTIYTYNFPSPAGCTDQPATFRIGDTGKAEVDCANAIAADADQPYGTTVAANGFACTIEESGVTCWSELSGKGFQIRREGQRTF
ncbi:MAG: hypothetical protein Q4E03_02095 [Trueperella sp.]|nr:hypothetical protein [Trueperella sp.]